MSMKKKAAAKRPPAGNVTIHEAKILPITRRSSAAIPRAMPTPMTAPTAIWVVETGIAVRDAMTTVNAAATVAQKPLLGVSAVIFEPMVRITRYP